MGAKVLKTVGRIMIVVVMIACLPIAIPRLFGLEEFNVISGSMEPTLKVGALVYVRDADISELTEGDIIAFYSGDTVVTHRVMEIDNNAGQVTTKGDANADKDLEPVAKNRIVGKVLFNIPIMGYVGTFLDSFVNKLLAIGLVVLGVLLNLIGKKLEELSALSPKDERFKDSVAIRRQPKRKNKVAKIILVCGLLIIVLAIGGVFFIFSGYGKGQEIYTAVTDSYTSSEVAEDWSTQIDVDFDALQEINDDVIGWLYVEGTDISYPIMYSGDNEKYLHNAWNNTPLKAGSIFLEGANNSNLSDNHTVIYGHNMRDGSMFGHLKKYKADNTYVEEHRYFQVITKEHKYRYEIFSYFDIEADGYVYVIPYDNEEELNDFAKSLLRSAYRECGQYHDSQIVTLSTCSTTGMRFTVHGSLCDAK